MKTAAAAAQCRYSSSLMSESSASTSPSITDFFPLQQETTRPMRKAYEQKTGIKEGMFDLAPLNIHNQLNYTATMDLPQ